MARLVLLAPTNSALVLFPRRNRSAKHYRHRASPDCNTVASYDSSSSESRGGLNRYYRQAWENLHQSAGAKVGAAAAAHHAALRRKETMDEPHHGYRGGLGQGMRDGSELVVTDVAAYPNGIKPSAIAAAEKKRHHHHHHHHHHGAQTGQMDWRHKHARQQRY